MKSNLSNNVSNGLRLIACSLAIFFVVLAVFDGFEEEDEIEYFGEFVSEADFDFVDFPESISRPTGNSKINKLDRIPLVKFFDRIFNLFTLEKVFNIMPSPEFPQVISGYNIFISNSILANAP